jgi:hypothetical protein
MVEHETVIITQPHNASWTYKFCPNLFIFYGPCMTTNLWFFQEPIFVVMHELVSVGWCEGLVCGWGTLPPLVVGPWPVQVWNVSVIILKHRRWRGWSCSELKCPGDGITAFMLSHEAWFVHMLHISRISLVLWLISEYFSVHHGYYSLLENDTYLSTCLHFVCVPILLLSGDP